MSVQVVMESQSRIDRIVERLAELGECVGGRYETGGELLERLSDTPMDVIVAGKHLTDMNGFELARRIRTREVGSINTYVPVVLVGANFSQDEVMVAIESGVNQIIRPPITTDELRKKLAVALEWQR